MVRSILYPSVKYMRQEMLIKEGYQVLHNCAFVQDSWEEKELNVKPKTLEEIRTELGVCRSPVFCRNSQLSGGDNLVNFIIMKFKLVVGFTADEEYIIVAWKLNLFLSCLVVLFDIFYQLLFCFSVVYINVFIIYKVNVNLNLNN